MLNEIPGRCEMERVLGREKEGERMNADK